MIERVGFGAGTITVEYQLAPSMVVFSHDFAALRDNRGLFSGIAAQLPPGYGYLLFDYYDTDDEAQTVQIKTFAEQLKRLAAVMDWLQTKKEVKHTHLIGHALGCIVAAKLNPRTIERMLLLAPPTVVDNQLRRYREADTAKQQAGIWRIALQHDQELRVPNSFFGEMKHIDAESELAELGLLREYLIILPSFDAILPDADYTELIVMPSVHAEIIEATDHDFAGEGRAQLFSLLNDRLLGKAAAV